MVCTWSALILYCSTGSTSTFFYSRPERSLLLGYICKSELCMYTWYILNHSKVTLASFVSDMKQFYPHIYNIYIYVLVCEYAFVHVLVYIY